MTKHHINIFILILVYAFILVGAYVYADHEQGPGCTTDSDCGCTDDCLDPMPGEHDEADTTISKERN